MKTIAPDLSKVRNIFTFFFYLNNNVLFSGAWKRRAHPDPREPGPFGSLLSSRSVLDAVVEEEMSEEEEEDEDSIAVLEEHEEPPHQNNGQAAMILVHDSRSSSSSNASSYKLNLDV